MTVVAPGPVVAKASAAKAEQQVAYEPRPSENAAAAGVLNDRTIPTPFLPYIDPIRLRAAISNQGQGHEAGALATLLPTIRQVTHQWNWDRPAQNAAAVSLQAAIYQNPIARNVGGPWHVRWATQSHSISEVLDRDTNARSVATAVLPDGRWPPRCWPMGGWSRSPAASTARCGCGTWLPAPRPASR
jgi:hypothetical protein